MKQTTRWTKWARAAAGGLAGVVLVGSLWAADQPGRSGWSFKHGATNARPVDDATSRPAEEAAISLHHSNAPWERVLNRLAQESGSTLTLQDVPPGSFDRLDRTRYTRTEAIRILNRELEPIGHRILVKDDHLTVLDLAQARSMYRRPVAPDSSTDRNGAREAPGEALTRARQRRAQLEQRFDNITRNIEARRGQIVQVSGETEGDERLSGGSQPTASQTTAPSAEDLAMTESVYQPENRPAVEVAQMLYRSFKARSQLLDEGPRGLPAFRVFRQAREVNEHNLFAARKADDVWFTMEIDTDRNRLVLHAPRYTTHGLTKLISRLDTPPQPDEPDTRLVQGTKETMHVARQLQPELGRMRQPRGATGGEADGPPARELAFQQPDAVPPQNQAGQPPGQQQLQPQPQQPAESQQQMPSALSGLRGEVTLEAIEDLNLLILRGNEEDLRQVQEVIDTIEQLAQGTRPEIHILFLQNVNSEALAELLSDVYERLGNMRNVGADQASQTVNVVPIATPNAIIIMAPTNIMQSVIDLAEELDRPGDPGSEVHIFPLKSAVATQVVTVLEEFYEERTGLGARITATADVRTNTVIVQARPAELAEVRLIIRKMDRGKSNSVNQVRVVPLKQAAADELAEFLTNTIQGILNPPIQQAGVGGFGAGNQGAQELRDTRAVVLEFLKRDGNAQQLIRSGLLSDVRVTGDLRTNSLTVVAPEQTMTLLLELIDILDQPSAAIADIKVFQLQNADATAAVQLLNELFAADDENELGIAISGATDTSSTLIPLKFSVDPRTNTVIAIGGLDALTVVEAILTRLDASELRERETTVLKLRNSRAEDVALAINEFVTQHLNLVQIDPTRISTGEIIDQTYIVVPEPATNTLLISASPRYFQDILDLAKELDMVPPQVFISALLVEVDLLETDEFGVELGFQDPVLFDRSATDTESGQIVPGFNFPGFPGAQAANFVAASPSVVGSQGLSSFALGRTNSDLAFGGLVLSASSDAVSVLVRALKARRNVRVLSAPKVHALDNQEAIIQDGQLVPLVQGVTQTGFASSPNINYQQTGLILSVTPRITPEGEVVMGVSAQKSALSGSTVPVFFDSTSGNTINSPIIDQTIASTSVMVKDGQTVVLGGIIIDSETVNERKVPWFGDLPYLGHAFRFDSSTQSRSELLIFLTPHIINNDADFELVKQVETERLNFFEHEAEEIHGPLFSVPRPQPEFGYDGQYPPGGPYPTGGPYPHKGQYPHQEYRVIDPQYVPTPGPNAPPGTMRDPSRSVEPGATPNAVPTGPPRGVPDRPSRGEPAAPVRVRPAGPAGAEAGGPRLMPEDAVGQGVQTLP